MIIALLVDELIFLIVKQHSPVKFPLRNMLL